MVTATEDHATDRPGPDPANAKRQKGDAPPPLEARGLFRRFGDLIANDGVSLDVRAGEVHAIIGENGAGKSTLMNMLYGLGLPDEGSILVDGEPVTITSPEAAHRLGIAMVHQHFMLVPNMTGLENILLGMPTTGSLARGRRALRARLEEIELRYGFTVDLDTPVMDMAVGAQQRVELLKALVREARVLILDEPTAVLTPQESDLLFGIIDSLRKEGVGVVFISHKLAEVMRLADRATVMRGGKVVGSVGIADTDPDALATLMVGEKVSRRSARSDRKAGPAILRLQDVGLNGRGGKRLLNGIDLTVHEGEILGIAGVSGNGQSELLDLIIGSRLPDSGRITLGDQELAVPGRGASPAVRRRLGLGFVAEDRLRSGAVARHSAAKTLMLGYQWHPDFVRRGLVRTRALFQACTRTMIAQNVQPRSPGLPMLGFSGGNQQKLVIGRELMHEPHLMVIGEPSRGVDIGAVTRIHDQLISRRNDGHGALVVSSDLDELLGLCDRIIVMHEGRLMGEQLAHEADRRTIGLMMAGRRAG